MQETRCIVNKNVETVPLKILCPACHNILEVDDSNIPAGAKYEVTCKKCGTMMMVKKENLEKEKK